MERVRHREKEMSGAGQDYALEPAQVPCLILVGGLGTRLRSISNDLPKPMVNIAGHPFLEYIIRWLQLSGFRKLILCVGYRAEKIREFFGNGTALGVELAYSEEVEPLGTWGAIRQTAGCVSAPHFVVLNGDSWLEVDLQELLRFHMSRRSLATIAAVEVANAARFGSMRVGPTGVIEAFLEKDCGSSCALVNGGVYVFSREVFAAAPMGASSLEKDVFPLLISRRTYAMRVQGFFIDIGIPTEYQRLQENAQQWVARMRLQNGELTC
jgi:NDP-sugar pyrophosphorylase family protein